MLDQEHRPTAATMKQLMKRAVDETNDDEDDEMEEGVSQPSPACTSSNARLNSMHDFLDFVERQGANSSEPASAHEMLKIKATKALTAPGLTGIVSTALLSQRSLMNTMLL